MTNLEQYGFFIGYMSKQADERDASNMRIAKMRNENAYAGDPRAQQTDRRLISGMKSMGGVKQHQLDRTQASGVPADFAQRTGLAQAIADNSGANAGSPRDPGRMLVRPSANTVKANQLTMGAGAAPIPAAGPTYNAGAEGPQAVQTSNFRGSAGTRTPGKVPMINGKPAPVKTPVPGGTINGVAANTIKAPPPLTKELIAQNKTRYAEAHKAPAVAAK